MNSDTYYAPFDNCDVISVSDNSSSVSSLSNLLPDLPPVASFEKNKDGEGPNDEAPGANISSNEHRQTETTDHKKEDGHNDASEHDNDTPIVANDDIDASIVAEDDNRSFRDMCEESLAVNDSEETQLLCWVHSDVYGWWPAIVFDTWMHFEPLIRNGSDKQNVEILKRQMMDNGLKAAHFLSLNEWSTIRPDTIFPYKDKSLTPNEWAADFYDPSSSSQRRRHTTGNSIFGLDGDGEESCKVIFAKACELAENILEYRTRMFGEGPSVVGAQSPMDNDPYVLPGASLQTDVDQSREDPTSTTMEDSSFPIDTLLMEEDEEEERSCSFGLQDSMQHPANNSNEDTALQDTTSLHTAGYLCCSCNNVLADKTALVEMTQKNMAPKNFLLFHNVRGVTVQKGPVQRNCFASRCKLRIECTYWNLLCSMCKKQVGKFAMDSDEELRNRFWLDSDKIEEHRYCRSDVNDTLNRFVTINHVLLKSGKTEYLCKFCSTFVGSVVLLNGYWKEGWLSANISSQLWMDSDWSCDESDESIFCVLKCVDCEATLGRFILESSSSNRSSFVQNQFYLDSTQVVVSNNAAPHSAQVVVDERNVSLSKSSTPIRGVVTQDDGSQIPGEVHVGKVTELNMDDDCRTNDFYTESLDCNDDLMESTTSCNYNNTEDSERMYSDMLNYMKEARELIQSAKKNLERKEQEMRREKKKILYALEMANETIRSQNDELFQFTNTNDKCICSASHKRR